MWVIKEMNNSWYVGYYEPCINNDKIFCFIENYEFSLEGKREAVRLCHYLNGGNN